jgi:ferredoxin
MTQITIDRDVCFGSGECVLAAPGVFELDDVGIARIRGDAAALSDDDAQRIAANCPSGALQVVDRPDEQRTEVTA